MKSKTFQKFVLLLIAVFFLAVQAYAGKASDETSATIRAAIKECVKNPGYDIVKDNNSSAVVVFTITREGKLLVKSIDTENEELSEYLTNSLSQICLCRLESPVSQNYRIKLSFRLI